MNAPGRHRIGTLWRRLAPYVERRHRLVFLGLLSLITGFGEAAVVLMIVQAAAAIAAGRHRIADHIGPFSHIEVTAPVLLVVAGITLAGLLVVVFLNALLAARMTVAAMKQARGLLVAAFIDTSWRLQSGERAGRLQELLSTHAERVGLGIIVLTAGMNAALVFVALLTTAVVVRPLAAVSILVGVVVVYLLLLPLTRMTGARSQLQGRLNSEYALRVTELVRLAREVRVFDVGSEMRESLDEFAENAATTQLRLRLLSRLLPSLYQYSALALVLVGMGIVYSLHSGSVGSLAAVVVFLVRALAYSQQVNMALHQAVELAPYIDELEAQLETYRADRIDPGGRPLAGVERLAFERVGFSYDPDLPVLEDVSFAIEAGEVVGIIGPSGGGKSTLVQLLLRLHRPDAGTILVNGEPAGEFALADWFGLVALVPQDNQLLLDTVAENIRFRRAHLERDDLERASRAAHLHEDVARWPSGYDTVIGSGAMDLSGGQRQRLGLARALAGAPNVLVLDEPTSALDMHSESLIQETLRDLRGSLTLFIVAHRMSTLAVCDRIMVLDGGRVEGFGTPDELRRSSPFFAEATRLAQLPL